MPAGERRRDLDGLRGLAALVVLGFHLDLAPLTAGQYVGGWAGVGLFFGLSGYLIAKVIDHDPGVGRFWLRRFARVIPAALVCFVLVLPVAALRQPDPLAVFEHYWTIGVELLFYAVAPFLRWRSWLLLAGAFALTLAFPPAVWDFSPHVRFAPFLIGMAVARSRLPAVRIPAIAVLAPVGVVSYGLYLWHYPILELFGRNAVAVAMAFGMAVVSYRYVELPAMRLARAGHLSGRIRNALPQKLGSAAPGDVVT